VLETPEAYTISLDLPGVDKASIDVKATDRTLVISAESQAVPADASESSTILSEVRYSTWSRRPTTKGLQGLPRHPHQPPWPPLPDQQRPALDPHGPSG